MDSDRYDVEYHMSDAPPFEKVKIDGGGSGLLAPELRDLISIDTVHDGDIIPPRLLGSPRVQQIHEDRTLWRHFVHQRDWGANLVARHLAATLGLDCYHRVTVARAVMDYNRLPGIGPREASPLEQLSISGPLATCLDHEEKCLVLAKYYDDVSARMERLIKGKLIKIAIHTYDAHNPSLTKRPQVSLVTRSHSYQHNSRLPFGLFDPMFPDVLVESCTDRILRDRIGLTLERAGTRVEHNYPYCLPDGSIEVRCQPWLFFQHIRRSFEERHPDTREQPSYKMVWRMLLNTNLRRTDSEILRGYLHRFQLAPAEHTESFKLAQEAYSAIHRFVQSDPELVESYRRSPSRPSTLAIEVRKDLLWKVDGETLLHPQIDAAHAIAEQLARAIVIYMQEDRQMAIERAEGEE